jgi:hypothetical protein
MSHGELKLIWVNPLATTSEQSKGRKPRPSSKENQSTAAEGHYQLARWIPIIAVIIGCGFFFGSWYMKTTLESEIKVVTNEMQGLKTGELKNIKDSVVELKTSLQKQLDKLDERLSRLEFPQFREKASAAGIQTSLAEFKQYQVKAASLGLSAPEYLPIRLYGGFSITSRGVLTDGTVYNLTYTIAEVQKDTITLYLGGFIERNGSRVNLARNRFDFPVKVGHKIPLNKIIGRMFGVSLPELTLAILAQPTPETLILASGSPTGSS